MYVTPELRDFVDGKRTAVDMLKDSIESRIAPEPRCLTFDDKLPELRQEALTGATFAALTIGTFVLAKRSMTTRIRLSEGYPLKT